MLTTAWSDSPPSRADLDAWVETVTKHTTYVFAQCGVTVDVARAEVVAVPARYLRVVANDPESWAGLAPLGADPEAFNHGLRERLTDDVRTLFNYARRGLPDRTLAVVVVDRIAYYAAQEASLAGGLSFPPVIYDHPGDFPTSNGVLIGAGYARCGAMPSAVSPRVVAHELGHMLLNVAHHETQQPTNLMSKVHGPLLRPDQCETIRTNLATLYR